MLGENRCLLRKVARRTLSADDGSFTVHRRRRRYRAAKAAKLREVPAQVRDADEQALTLAVSENVDPTAAPPGCLISSPRGSSRRPSLLDETSAEARRFAAAPTSSAPLLTAPLSSASSAPCSPNRTMNERDASRLDFDLRRPRGNRRFVPAPGFA